MTQRNLNVAVQGYLKVHAELQNDGAGWTHLFLYMCYSQVDHPQQRPVGSDFLSAGSSGKGAKATESLGAVEVLSASQCLLKFLLHFDCNMRIVSMESMIYIYIYRI